MYLSRYDIAKFLSSKKIRAFCPIRKSINPLKLDNKKCPRSSIRKNSGLLIRKLQVRDLSGAPIYYTNSEGIRRNFNLKRILKKKGGDNMACKTVRRTVRKRPKRAPKTVPVKRHRRSPPKSDCK